MFYCQILNNSSRSSGVLQVVLVASVVVVRKPSIPRILKMVPIIIWNIISMKTKKKLLPSPLLPSPPLWSLSLSLSLLGLPNICASATKLRQNTPKKKKDNTFTERQKYLLNNSDTISDIYVYIFYRRH